MRRVQELKLAYAAGIIDGEGSIVIRKRKDRKTFSGQISVAMCDDRAVRLLHNLFGGSLSKAKYEPPARNQYVWTVAAKLAEKCARTLVPYLRIKQAQAHNLIELQRLNRVIREDTRKQRTKRAGTDHASGAFSVDLEVMGQCVNLYETNKILNKRGAEVMQ